MASQRATKALRIGLSAIMGIGIASSTLVVASPALAKATVHESDSRGSVCDSDVAVIGVRGSGQDKANTYRKQYNFLGMNVPEWIGGGVGVQSYEGFQGTPIQSAGDANDHIEGFSNEVATAAFELRKQFPDSLKFGWVPVEYDAVGISNAFANKKEYTRSYMQGAKLVEDAVTNLVDNCMSTEIAIIGFSQGSQATHQAITDLDKKYRDRISSVVLIADPARDGESKVAMSLNEDTDNITYSPGFAGSGVFSTTSLLRAGVEPSRQTANQYLVMPPSAAMIPTPNPLPEDMKGRILNVCAEGDLVCNARPSSLLTQLVNIGSVHGEGYQSKDHKVRYERPASWAHGLISKNLLSDRVHYTSGNTYQKFSKTELCPRVNFIYAGGQYDSNVGGLPAGSGGTSLFGAHIPATMLDGIVDQKPGKSIGFKGVKWEAKGTYGLKADGGDEDYRSEVSAGVDATKRAIEESLSECKDARIILFGNEQGSQVVHEAVHKLDKDQLGKIDAVLLMADPMRSGEDSGVKEFAGVEGDTMGGEAATALLKSGGVLKGYAESKGVLNFPSELSGKVMSICAGADSLCNPDPKEDGNGSSMGAYNMFSTFWEEPSKWAADLIKK